MPCSKLPAMESLERESVRSLYEQAADRLRSHFMGMRPGERVPTEAELTRFFQVGRSTIRKALQRLVEEGLLVRSPGKGTFIARAVPCIIHSIDRVSAFMDTFRRNGEDVRTQMIDFGWLGREVSLPEKLRDWPRPVLRFDRLYVSRGIPHAVARVCLPYTIGNHISSADVESTPVYRMLREKFAQEPMGSEFLVSCEQPPKNISDLLEVSPSTSLLVLERITRDASGNPLEYTTHFLRPDIYRLSVHLGEEGAGV